ncbi:MAG TPA: Spy/CpxP family protein refolding chaperone [Vicinamibacteria bacterium]|nr:Spy/CpxP family protein refolding chaperone [Vicinamibacteria bacterium]
MKLTRRKNTLLVACALLTSMAVSAQQRGRGGSRGERHDFGPMRMLRELDLTEEQRQQVKTLFEQAAETGAHKRLMEARRSLNEAVENGETDEGAIRQLGYQVGLAEGDAAIERARVRAQVMELLTEEQKNKLAQLEQQRRQERDERRKRLEERRSRQGDSGKEL